MPNATSRQVLRDAAYAASMEGHQRRTERVSGTLPVAPRPVPANRAPRGKSATDQAETLAGLLTERAEKIQSAAVAEVRHYLGAELAALAAAPEEVIAAVQYDGERAEVSEGLRAGLLLAARLVADPGYEY